MIKTFLFTFNLMICSLSANFPIETLHPTLRAYLIHDFLSHEECETIIELAKPHLERSTVVNENNAHASGVVDSRRSSFGYFLPQSSNDPILKNIEMRIAAITGMPRENGEAFHVLRYEKGAQYEPHFDSFNPATPGGAAHLSHGGQRIASMIIYLNTPESGGETIFPKINLSVKAKKGTALLFYNCDEDGNIDPLSLHGGAPVIEGEKWIVTKWLRMKTFR